MANADDDNRINLALRELLQAWDSAADSWRDTARAEIALHHLDPLQARTREAAKTAQQLADLVRQVERDCL